MSDIEDEANAFAMELLMPEKFLRADIKKLGVKLDFVDGSEVEKLAKLYRVSVSLMTFRLGRLSAKRS